MRRKSHSIRSRTQAPTETLITFSEDRKWVLCKRVKTLFFSREDFEEILRRRSLHSYFSEVETEVHKKGE